MLDAGAGTGIMGEILPALGYPVIDGFDISPGMLARAEKKNLYRDLKHGVLGERLDYADDSYAGVTASGVFTEGHAPLDGLDELVRVVKPGGHIVFSVARIYLGDQIEAKAKALEDAGKWRRVGTSGLYDLHAARGKSDYGPNPRLRGSLDCCSRLYRTIIRFLPERRIRVRHNAPECCRP